MAGLVTVADPTRYNPTTLGVEGARPYGVAGNMPADAVVTGIRPHGRGTLYVSDAPFVESYADRATCAGTRTDGQPCKAKAKPGETHCASHDPN